MGSESTTQKTGVRLAGAAWPVGRKSPCERRGWSDRCARIDSEPQLWSYFAGNALSVSGTWFQNRAASLLVYRLTHSAFLLGVLTSASSRR
jgi:hypothetical protein